MVDSYVWGNVDRISPEAPVQIVSTSKRENRLGGAANVALNIKALGATPILCSVIGNEESGKTFLNILNEEEITDKGIVVDENRITTQKTRVIAHNQQLLRIDDETTIPIDTITTDKLKEVIKSTINNNKIDGIIFQDYDKGIITTEIIDFVVQLAHIHNIPTLVDPKKNNFNYFKHITLFKPNFRELKEGLNLDISKGDMCEIKSVLLKLIKERDFQSVLLTLSEQGILMCSRNNCETLPAEIRDIADVSGAGDTVISMASLCLASNLNDYELAYLSNFAGGLVCEKVGVVPVNKNILMNELIDKNN